MVSCQYMCSRSLFFKTNPDLRLQQVPQHTHLGVSAATLRLCYPQVSVKHQSSQPVLSDNHPQTYQQHLKGNSFFLRDHRPCDNKRSSVKADANPWFNILFHSGHFQTFSFVVGSVSEKKRQHSFVALKRFLQANLSHTVTLLDIINLSFPRQHQNHF